MRGNKVKDDNIKEYFSDKEFCEEIQTEGNYKKTVEKAHGQIEIREYYQKVVFINFEIVGRREKDVIKAEEVLYQYENRRTI